MHNRHGTRKGTWKKGRRERIRRGMHSKKKKEKKKIRKTELPNTLTHTNAHTNTDTHRHRQTHTDTHLHARTHKAQQAKKQKATRFSGSQERTQNLQLRGGGEEGRELNQVQRLGSKKSLQQPGGRRRPAAARAAVPQ